MLTNLLLNLRLTMIRFDDDFDHGFDDYNLMMMLLMLLIMMMVMRDGVVELVMKTRYSSRMTMMTKI